MAEADQPPPSRQEIEDLERLAAGIIRSQGNRFIKELMREKKIALGANKDDFERNLKAAIEAGTLRLADVEEWLAGVEGWGNQHVYLYGLTSTITNELTEPKLRQAAANAGFGDLEHAPTVLEFPDEPTLTSVSFSDGSLRLIWQEASPGWTPAPEKDYREQEGLDLYEYRAYRQVERRTVTRFEVHKSLGLAALFVADPIAGVEHRQAVAEAKRVIAQLLNLSVLERNQLDISVVSRNMDQRNVPSNANPAPPIKTQKARLSAGGAYVEFAANSSEGSYADAGPIRDVRNAIRTNQLPSFQGTEGVFMFQPGLGPEPLTRALRVQLYGRDDRIRLWAQMLAAEVWTILQHVNTYK